MNSDELLTTFHSGVPLPVDATAERIYARATSSRRRESPRRRLALAVATAAICTAFGATALAGAFHGGTTENPQNSGTAGGDRWFNMVPKLDYERTDGTLTSISFTVNDDHFVAAVLNVQVVHTDVPLDQLPGTNPPTQVVFSEQIPMTATGSSEPDTPWWTVSGTVSPADWTGGCADGSYSVRFAVTEAGSTTPDPFDSGLRDLTTGLAWFRCSGS